MQSDEDKGFLLYNRSVQFISQFAQICWMGLRSGVWGGSPSFSVFQQILSAAGISSNSSFYGYCNVQFNKNNRKLLNTPSVLTILVYYTICNVYISFIQNIIYVFSYFCGFLRLIPIAICIYSYIRFWIWPHKGIKGGGLNICRDFRWKVFLDNTVSWFLIGVPPEGSPVRSD